MVRWTTLEGYIHHVYIGVECDVVLLARSIEGLQETKDHILAGAPGVSVHLLPADLSQIQELPHVFSKAVQPIGDRQHKQAVLVHNAGSLGDITKPIVEQTNPRVIQSYLAANFTSVFTLTSLFLSHFTEGARTVVNITSLLAVNYNYCFGLYSPGKAARNALMGVLAVENPDIRVLSYSPAVVDTDMIRTLGKESYSEKVTEGVKGLFEKKILLRCEQVVRRMVELLKEDKFKSGSMVDYYDEVK